MNTSVDTAFIRRAIELADLNAVRVALYHNTGDPEIGALPVTASLTPEQRAALIDRAVAWLGENAGPKTIDEPPTPELRRLMELATGVPMGDLEFDSRRDLPAFKPFPLAAEWETAPGALPEDFRVAIIGSGFSGLAAAVQMERLGIPYVVIERRAEPGGTWTINRYPDVRVDTSSNSYEFLFEKNYKWKEHFGSGKQVREYLTHVSRKYGVFENTRFNTDLKRAVFDEARDRWVLDVVTADGAGDRLEANFIISCTGVFANPKQPAFENLEAFRGQIVHPARWPEGLDLTGKRVAVIGNGSTGVQLLGAVARDAAHVSVFQRTPQWISPRDKYGAPVEPEMVWLLENFPAFWNWSRFMSFASLFQTHDMVLPDPEWQANGGQVNLKNDKLREMLTQYIRTQTDGREDLIERLVPDYAPFSRRPVVDNGWYRALTRDNVELVTDGIARLTETGIETEDGKVRELDVIITATGFDIVKYLWPAQWVGKGGVDLHESWSSADGPRAYLGMMVPEFPNMFMLYGPNSQPVSGGTHVPIWYIVWSAYAARCMMRVLEAGKSRVEVSREAFARYNAAMDEESLKLILMRREGAMEKNYYVNQEHNRLQVNAPWYGPEFHRMCTEIAWDDLLIS
jgi:4-hydroxyacetophenone monooxygenase